MLQPPSRPRAPSTATLRILYQLAYISSGTALGVGALCAEERRRRTQVVQKVADNARRLRQSPRYAHSVAVRVAHDDSGNEAAWWGAEGSVKGEEIPSVVHQGYERFLRGEDGGRRGKKKTAPLRKVQAEGRRIDKSTVKLPDHQIVKGEKGRSEAKGRTAGLGSVSPQETRPLRGQRRTSQTASPSLLDKATSRMLPLSQDSPKPRERSSENDLMAQLSRREYILKGPKKRRHPIWKVYKAKKGGQLRMVSDEPQPFHATKEGMRQAPNEGEYTNTVGRFRTNHLWDVAQLSASTCEDHEDQISRDVNMFFWDVAFRREVTLSCDQACTIAGHLLRLSFQNGDFFHVESLLLWKIAVGRLAVSDLRDTIASFSQLAKSDPTGALHLCLSLFTTDAYCNLSASDRRQLDIALLSEVQQPDYEAQYTMYLQEWIWPMDHAQNTSRGDADDLKRLVEDYLAQSTSLALTTAVDVFCLATTSRPPVTSTSLFAQLFEACATSLHLSQAAKLLRLAETRMRHVQLPGRANDFIRLCAKADAHGMLREVFEQRLRSDKPRLHLLDEESCVHLCKIFVDDKKVFGRLYGQCSQGAKEALYTSFTTARVESLRSHWKMTRNFQQVEEMFRSTPTSVPSDTASSEEELEARLIRDLHIAMCEIQILANKPELVLPTLAKIQGSQSDCHVGALVALSFAKQGNWKAFHALLERIRTHQADYKWTLDAIRVFNAALHLFSKHHSAIETSTLARDAICELRFAVDRSTSNTLLTSFVIKGNLGLIKTWLRPPGTVDLQVRLEPSMAVSLIRRWYLLARHSHVLVMWLCRQLAELAPSVDVQGLVEVVREAIDYDMRNLRGVNAPSMKHEILARQVLLANSGGALPKPGVFWNGVLYDDDRQFLTQETSGDSPELNTMTESDSLRKKHASCSEDSGEGLRLPVEPRGVEKVMISYLSQAKYTSVIEAYQKSASSSGLPASPLALQLAVEASLRLYGHETEANDMLSAADKAGMNISCAFGQLLIHRMRDKSQIDENAAKQSRQLVLQHYRTNDENGWPVQHKVATKVASSITEAGFPDLAVNLLDAISKSRWAAKHPFDVAAFTAWLQAYAALGNTVGIEWIVSKVLESDMLIDLAFLRSLKRAQRPRLFSQNGNVLYDKQSARVRARLGEWLGLCRQKRNMQMWESRAFGRKLVHVLASALNNDGLLPPEPVDLPANDEVVRREETRRAQRSEAMNKAHRKSQDSVPADAAGSRSESQALAELQNKTSAAEPATFISSQARRKQWYKELVRLNKLRNAEQQTQDPASTGTVGGHSEPHAPPKIRKTSAPGSANLLSSQARRKEWYRSLVRLQKLSRAEGKVQGASSLDQVHGRSRSRTALSRDKARDVVALSEGFRGGLTGKTLGEALRADIGTE